jgi:Ca-activated chloride channel family protein
MRFAYPHALWLLGLVPLLIVGIALRFGWRRRLMMRLGHPPQLARLTDSISHFKRLIRTAALVVATTLLILVVARPQAGERTTLAPYVGIDIVVALDFSNSMLARDAYPSRLERAKAELNRLIDELRGDRVGLVAFAGDTLSYPLTTDYAAAKLFWRTMMPRDMPVGGTAMGKAIVAATRLLTGVRGKGEPRSQVILLLTDGEDHESEPIEAAKQAAKLGIRIYTVGIGSRSGEPIPEIDEDGKVVGYMSSDGHPITSKLDHETLAKIAELSGGRYIEMEARSFGVEPILKAMSKLTRSRAESRLVKHYDDVYEWFLFPAFLLLLIELSLSERRRESVVASTTAPRRTK